MRSRGRGAPMWISAVVALSFACDGDRRAVGELDVSVDTSGAYPVVRSAGLANQWSAELITRIGDVDADSAGGFGGVRSVLLDSAGRVYVVDPSYVQLSVFDTTGALVTHWGRKGSGPGEYQLPYSIAWVGDSLALLDPGVPRIMLLGPDGRWAGEWPYARYTGSNVIRLYRTPTGFWALGIRRAEGKLTRTFVRYDAMGPRDTLDVFLPPGFVSAGAECRRPDGSISFFTAPFGPLPFAIPDADGRQHAVTTTSYRVALLAPGTFDTLRVIERPVVGAPITDAEWAEASRELADWRAKTPDEHCDRESWDRPAAKPPVEWIFLDDEGRLWVQVLTADGRAFDVFGSDGVLEATVTGLPSAGDVDPSVVNGRVAIVVRDSNDVASVVLYRLRK